MKKIFFAITLTVFTIASFGQDEKASQAAYLNHIALLVKDLQTTTRFYENVLQLKKIPEPFKDGLHTWFGLGPAGQIHLIQAKDTISIRNKHDHLCFSVRSIDEFVSRLNANNIPFMDWSGKPQTITNRVDGIKQVFFRDPDGHWIEVNDDYPKVD